MHIDRNATRPFARYTHHPAKLLRRSEAGSASDISFRASAASRTGCVYLSVHVRMCTSRASLHEPRREEQSQREIICPGRAGAKRPQIE